MSAPTSTLSQITALVLVYRRLIRLAVVAPCAAVSLPLLLRLARTVLNVATDGHAGLTMALTAALIVTALVSIHQLATTLKSRDAAWQANRRHLPVAFVVNAALARWVLGPIAQQGWGGSVKGAVLNRNSWFLMSFRESLWLAVALALLGLAVIIRYVGPLSIRTYDCTRSIYIYIYIPVANGLVALTLTLSSAEVRCSTVPLANNPVYTVLSQLLNNPWSLMKPNDPTNKPVFASATRGRRFQRPTWSMTIWQALAAVGFGVVVANIWTWLLPAHPIHHRRSSSSSSSSSAFMDFDSHVVAQGTACILILLLPLLTTTLGNGPGGHELAPKDYFFSSGSDIWDRVTPVVKQAVHTAVLVVILTCAATWATTTTSSSSVLVHSWWMVQLSMACLFMSLYVHLLDFCIRTSLFTPLEDIRALVAELEYDGTPLPYTTVLVQAILRHCPTLAKDILASPSTYPSVAGHLDHDELQRAIGAGKVLSNHWLVYHTDQHPEAALEEDVLQLTVLARLGYQPWSAPQREILMRTRASVVAVVRALCVFLQGLVATLHTCSSSSLSRATTQPIGVVAGETWILPPGLQCAAEWAITGLSRCLVESLPFVAGVPPDWISSCLAVLIPSALETMFAVRQAVTEFATHERLLADYLLALTRVCDDGAARVLQRIVTPLPLDALTLAWAKDVVLLAAPQNRLVVGDRT
jgi:hypothetical protein